MVSVCRYLGVVGEVGNVCHRHGQRPLHLGRNVAHHAPFGGFHPMHGFLLLLPHAFDEVPLLYAHFRPIRAGKCVKHDEAAAGIIRTFSCRNSSFFASSSSCGTPVLLSCALRSRFHNCLQKAEVSFSRKPVSWY